MEYQKLVRRILDTGTRRPNRTGVDTISIFGTQSRYDMQKGFPLLTTKKVNFKAIVAELLWFLSGSTSINDLDSKIWDEWADQLGDLGPVYGFQWRHWGADYECGSGDAGFDQIQDAINTIKDNPMSRRIIVSAWNPDDVPNMALPPCHLLFQFNVRPGKIVDSQGPTYKGFIDCQMYQRSADVALGVPFNIASYALLTHLIANECGYLPGELIHTIGDAHAYVNHIEGLHAQLRRSPLELPTLALTRETPVDEITPSDIVLNDYNPHPPIRFEVAI